MALVLMFGALALVPPAAAGLLRWARCPGWSLVGGVAAGFLLGPTIFGAVLPAQYEAIFLGGEAQHRALEAIISRQGADRIVAERAGLDQDQIAELARSHQQESAEAGASLDAARQARQRWLWWCALSVVALVLLGAGWVAEPLGRDRTDKVATVSIGIWSAAFPGGAAFFLAYFLWHEPAATAAVLASAVAVGPWVLGSIDREAANRAELGGARLVGSAGRIATVLGTLLAAWGLWSAKGTGGLVAAAVLAASAAAWLRRPSPGRFAGVAIHHLLLPTMAALAVLRINLHELSLGALGPIVLILLVSGDGRWLGAFAGAMLPGGRRGLRTMRLVLGSMAAGPTQLAFATVAAHTQSVRGDFVLALVLGAVLIEVTAPARRSMARRLAQLEDQVIDDG